MSETAKIREQVIQYCNGFGVDLGCGNDKIRPEAVGIDLRNLPGVDVIGNAARKLKWAVDGQFDYVYSSHFLEHLDEPVEALAEWYRILKPRGHLILYLPHKDYYTEYNPEHKQELTMGLVLTWLNEIGSLEIIKSKMDVGTDRYSFLIIAKKGE